MDAATLLSTSSRSGFTLFTCVLLAEQRRRSRLVGRVGIGQSVFGLSGWKTFALCGSRTIFQLKDIQPSEVSCVQLVVFQFCATSSVIEF